MVPEGAEVVEPIWLQSRTAPVVHQCAENCMPLSGAFLVDGLWPCAIIGPQMGRRGRTPWVACSVTADGQRRGAMGLEEHALREWVRRVAHGEASRRHFLHTLLGLGLSGPLIAEMLATSAPAAAQGTSSAQHAFTPTRRGG